MQEIPMRMNKPHEPGQRKPEKYCQVKRGEQSQPGAAPAFDAVEYEQDQRRNKGAHRPFDQSREPSRGRPEQIPVPARSAFRCFRQVAGKNRAADEEGKGNVENHRARVDQEEGHRRHDDHRQQTTARPVHFPAEPKHQGQEGQAKSD